MFSWLHWITGCTEFKHLKYKRGVQLYHILYWHSILTCIMYDVTHALFKNKVYESELGINIEIYQRKEADSVTLEQCCQKFDPAFMFGC